MKNLKLQSKKEDFEILNKYKNRLLDDLMKIHLYENFSKLCDEYLKDQKVSSDAEELEKVKKLILNSLIKKYSKENEYELNEKERKVLFGEDDNKRR